MLKIVLIIPIDFSMSNLTFDERNCIHLVTENRPNKYRYHLQAIIKSFKLISPSCLFYSFGANSVNKVTRINDLFVGTGDLLNPIVITDNLEREIYAALSRVELNSLVKFDKVLKKAIDFAEKEFGMVPI